MKMPRPWLAALVAACTTLAPAAYAAPKPEAGSKAAAPSSARTVRGVRITGFRRVEESAIRIHVSHPVGVPLDAEVVDRDIKAVYRMGFFENVWVTTSDTDGGLSITYHVAERPYISHVAFEGNEHVDKADLEAVVAIRPRTVFDPQKAWEGLREARKVYAGEGYPDADIRYELTTGEDGSTTVTYKIDEKPRVLVEEIYFQGVHAFSEFKLRRVMTTRRKWFLSWATGAGVLKQEELSTDVERLTAFYYDNGYIQVRVDDPEVVRKGDHLELTVRIEEGDQYRVGDVTFTGEVLASQENLAEASRLKTGEIFRPSKLRDAIFGVTEAYGDFGRAFAEAVPSTEVNEDTKTVDVAFQMTSGPVVSVDRIEIEGNTKTRDYVIRRELRQQEGEQFSGRGLRTSKERAKRLGIFDDVEVTSARTNEADKVDLKVKVKEGRTGTFAAGAGFSSEDALLANARITERNLFGRGQIATFNVDFGTRRKNIRFAFTEPWAFDVPLSLGFDIFNWGFQFDDFERGGTGFALRASYPLWEAGLREILGASLDNFRVGLEYRIEETIIEGISRTAPASIQNERGTQLTSSMRPSLSRNTVDQPFDPTEGSINTMQVEFAGIGGESRFIKLDVSSRWYWPVYKTESGLKFIYSLAGTFGYGVGNRGLSGEELPLAERYFPGGINTVRGFQNRTLGPRENFCEVDGINCQSSPVGGSSQLIINNEVIFPIIPDAGVRGVVFFDAGNAFLEDGGIDLAELRMAAGVGLRWLSPFGPLRIEVGFPVNSKSDDEESLVLFSFGTPY